MSLMTTTKYRGNPNTLAIAPTQNTAPVYEFTCLYTSDLRKKKKTWHDGSLRFHTFNRRVMVYDDSKNYIGDLHYREAEELLGGEELKLDKGVLVEVGERIGRTDTDLAPILDKGRSEDGNREARGQPTPKSVTQRTFAAHTQGRPKSLAAVLGASQGPTGRARMAFKSPYEQLHPVRPDNVPEQPATKRQRILPGKENAVAESKRIEREQQLTSPPQRSRVSTPVRPKAPLTMKKEINISEGVINISSEDENDPSSLFSSLAEYVPRRKSRENAPSNLLGSSPQKPQHRVQTKQKVRPKVKTSLASEHVVAVPKPSKRSTTPTVAEPSNRLRGVTSSRLRFAPEVPKMMLMYQDLLFSSVASGPARSSISSRDISVDTGDHAQNLQARSNVPDVQNSADINTEEDIYDFELPDDFDTRKRQSSATSADERNNQLDSMEQQSSLLFFKQSPSFLEQEDVGGIRDGDLVVGSPEPGISTDAPAARSKSPSPEGSPIRPRQSPNHSPKPVQIAEQPAPISNLTLMDQRLMIPPPQLQQQPALAPVSPRSHSFRRVLSENDSPAHAKMKTVVSPVSRAPTMLDGLQPRRRISKTLLPFNGPTKLQRASSDTAAMLQPLKAAPARVDMPLVIEEEEDTDVGPWSSKEAFLLFDWWPPGREKPVYTEVSEHRGRSLHDEDDI